MPFAASDTLSMLLFTASSAVVISEAACCNSPAVCPMPVAPASSVGWRLATSPRAAWMSAAELFTSSPAEEKSDPYRSSTAAAWSAPSATSRRRSASAAALASMFSESAKLLSEEASDSATSETVSANTSLIWYDTVSAPWPMMRGATAFFFSFE